MYLYHDEERRRVATALCRICPITAGRDSAWELYPTHGSFRFNENLEGLRIRKRPGTWNKNE